MSTTEVPRWRGINHLALITPDMDQTVRFYHGVLGMRLVATLSAGPLRHTPRPRGGGAAARREAGVHACHPPRQRNGLRPRVVAEEMLVRVKDAPAGRISVVPKRRLAR